MSRVRVMAANQARPAEGMRLPDVLKILRSRWITIAVSVLAGIAGAVALTLATTPLFQADSRLFVSTTAGASASDLYQGNRLSQDRVLSYIELLMGKTLAQRTIDKLNLDVSAEQLAKKVSANAKLDTVLINVRVTDPSPVRARDIANALSDEFVLMVRELETPTAGAKPDARVVVEQRASILDKQVAPQPLQNLVFGLFLGLLAGIGLAFLRNSLDNTVKDQPTLEQLTGTGMIGAIPMDKHRSVDPAISFDTDNSVAAESFRKLRTNLHFLAVDNPPRMLVVTSAVPSEGKSTTSINIALALAEAGNNVLLLDGDMRRPSLANYLDIMGSVGLSTILSGQVPLTTAIQETRFARLAVLAAGATPPNPSELLSSQAAKTVLHELRDQYDYVVVDSPPLLAVTDAAVLAANSDGAIMMTRFGKTKRDQLSESVRILEDVGATLLGAVLTMTPVRGPHTYSYRYNYYTSAVESTAPADSLGGILEATNRIDNSENHRTVSKEH